MNYKTFSELWEIFVTNSPKVKTKNPIPLSPSCSKETIKALSEYGQGNKTKINSIRKFLNEKRLQENS